MRNPPIATVDPADLLDTEREHVAAVLDDPKSSGTLAIASLPDGVRMQLFFVLDSVACGKRVTAVADGKSLATTEAAELLGMSRTLLSDSATKEASRATPSALPCASMQTR